MSDPRRTVADTTAPAPDRGDQALLAVYPGPEGAEGTRIISLPDGAEVTFGRTRAATVSIDSDRVSRMHARILRRGDRITVEDLGSRNGTRVNGRPIEGATDLASGDQVDVGPATTIVSLTSALVLHPRIGSTAHLDERLQAEVDRGRRFRRGFGLIMMHIGGVPAEIDRVVAALAAEVRPMDTIAEYGPDDIAVLLPESRTPELTEAASRLIDAASAVAPAVEVRLGLAAFPVHGTTPDQLIERARASLRLARPGQAPAIGGAEHGAGAGGVELVVVDPQMRRVFALVDKVAASSMTVLIVGETGAGKEVVAEELHRRSDRRGRGFVRLNCACLPEGLLESELFGHERGAFTGAERRKPGYFEVADGGTLFLDEIGELSPDVQAKFLRVLETRRFTRVGGTSEVEVDVRVVCATNRDLERDVIRGAFREDLFFRISAFTILVPPLRDRRPEIAPLAEHFLAQIARAAGTVPPVLSLASRVALERYGWPGNVRELRNVLERALVLQASGVIEPEDLPERVREAAPVLAAAAVEVADSAEVDVRRQIADVERATILAALEACGGNQTHAARRLGLSRRALIYRMEKHGLKPSPSGG